MIEAVLFDLDGTVANTNELIYESFRRLFDDKMMIEVSDQEIYSLFGEPLENSLKKYSKNAEELLPFFREFNELNHDRMIQSFTGVEEALIMLKAQGLKLGIVTSKRERMARRSLEMLGLSDYFEVLITPEYTLKHKPEPDPIYKACELLGGIDPKNTIMVGDASYDILCGNRAGATSVAVSYSMIHPDSIKKAEPHYVVDDLRELVELIHKLNAERN